MMEASPTPTVPFDERPTLLSLLGPRFLVAASLGIVLVALALGIPTDIIPNPWFVRMFPAETGNYFFWVGSSILTGILLATYVLPRETRDRIAAASAGSGLLGLLAVGCPVCNKLVVAMLGVSGAFNYFAPMQPYLGAAGLLMAAAALIVRLRGAQRACTIPGPLDPPA
jgi:hypothetical protein